MTGDKQKKVSIPHDEMELAKEQARKDGFGNADGSVNVTGWVRWLIRIKCGESTEKATEAGA